MKSYHATWNEDRVTPAADARMSTLLADYVHAWESADVVRLVSLLRDDAIVTMPPFAAWFQGRAAIETFLAAVVFAGPTDGRFKALLTGCNLRPSVAIYQRDESGMHRASALNVLTIVNGQVAEMHDFLTFDGRLFERLGLPVSL
jgi:RNA polymerase sigma-70 factor (ECF subfamily)